MFMRRFTSLLLAAASPVWLAAQDPATPPAFKTAVELVQIDVSVLDGKRQPVRGLTAADFTVLEDGQPRPIRVFETVELPARPSSGPTTTWEAVAASAVATNQVGAQDGRLVFILMDRTIPVGQPTMAAKKIGTAAIEALGPGDLAAVVTTSGGIPQTLTANRARLLAALNRGDWSTGLSREQKAVTENFVTLDPLSDGRCLCGICVLETVTNLANAVRNTPRRSKSLLFIGSSVILQSGPRPMSEDVGCDYRLRDARAKMFDALDRSHLIVHSIDPGGLVSLGPQTSAGTPNRAAAPRMAQMQAEINDHLRNQGSLQVLPDLTGGRVVLNTNAPETKVPEIFHESDAYYVIGFEPGRSLRDEPRSIKVNVARDGVRVSATRAVAAAAPSMPSASVPGVTAVSPLESALSALVPVARLPLDLSVAAFASPDGPNAFVSVSVNAASFAERVGSSLPLDVGVAVLDQRSRHVASAKQTSTVTLPRDATAAPIIELQSHVTLKPGDYELRAAVAHRDSGLASSVFAQLAIPPFADVPLSLSNLMLGTREREEGPADAAAPLIPIVPTTQRTFRRGDRVWSFMQVYQGTERKDELQAVAVRTTVVDERDRPVYDRSLTLRPDEFVKRRADVRIILPLANLPPGRYVFRIDATLGQRIASRGVPFIVE
jgi:VWFA-related protein